MLAVSGLAKTSCRNLRTACGAGGVCLNMHTGSSAERRAKVHGTEKEEERLKNWKEPFGFTASVEEQQDFLRQDSDIFLVHLLHQHIAAGD